MLLEGLKEQYGKEEEMFLNCHTYYSLRYGMLSPEQLVKAATAAGAESIALTDINNSTAMPEFVSLCRKAGIIPIAGIEFRSSNRLLYIGLAMNNDGFRELNELLTHHNLSGEPLPFPAPRFLHCYAIYPAETVPERKLFDNEFIGVRSSAAGSAARLADKFSPDKMVVLHSVTLSTDREHQVHRCLRAIAMNSLLSQLPESECAAVNECFITEREITVIFSGFPEIIANTRKVIKSCSVEFREGVSRNKKLFSASRYDDKLLLRKLAMEGMRYRYGSDNKSAAERIEKELDIIDKLGFASYFLITWDMIRYSMSRGFYHVGRGSGANSIVAYCLKITNVDPIDLNLYFERFINPARSSPPDFDIDYSWRERDEVTDYLFKRYGREHTALLGTINRFRDRSILRELGKVYGLPPGEIDELAENPGSSYNNSELTDRILHDGAVIADFPNMRSIHAGGVIISEEPLTCYTALDLPPKGFPVTQWDMYTAEELGYEKLDVLSQRGIGHISEAAAIIGENRGIEIDMNNIELFKRDTLVAERLREGETKGCFYIESPSMKGLLSKLRCSDYRTLVAASSIIRPGVAKSGMMREYIKRYHDRTGFSYIHPIMKEQLEETFGVMVYQEDVLKICHHFAGLNLSDADTLRRAMSGKYRSREEMRRITSRFFEGCREKGHSDELAREVWRQIESFAGYSFSKAHSASYAAESMQSLFLKAHYPLEFMVAVINNFGGFYRTWVYFHEATRWGAVIHPPCINRSLVKTRLIGEKDIYTGFIHIERLESRLASEIVRAREETGNYAGLEDFFTRTTAGLEQVVLLIRSGAFSFTQKSKPALLWEAHMLAGGTSKRSRTPLLLFPTEVKKHRIPELKGGVTEDAFDEIELLGFPVSLNWFDMIPEKLHLHGCIKASDMMSFKGKRVMITGRLVTIKYIKTVKGEFMCFGYFIDEAGDYFDTTHFPSSLRSFPFRGSGTYIIEGRVSEEFGYASIEADKIRKLPLIADPRH